MGWEAQLLWMKYSSMHVLLLALFAVPIALPVDEPNLKTEDTLLLWQKLTNKVSVIVLFANHPQGRLALGSPVENDERGFQLRSNSNTNCCLANATFSIVNYWKPTCESQPTWGYFLISQPCITLHTYLILSIEAKQLTHFLAQMLIWTSALT